jgi:hypothetical protein
VEDGAGQELRPAWGAVDDSDVLGIMAIDLGHGCRAVGLAAAPLGVPCQPCTATPAAREAKDCPVGMARRGPATFRRAQRIGGREHC